MTERKNAKAMASGSLQDRIQAGLDLPLQGRFVCVWSSGLCVKQNFNLFRVALPYLAREDLFFLDNAMFL